LVDEHSEAFLKAELTGIGNLNLGAERVGHSV
jgi:hypothetical protein